MENKVKWNVSTTIEKYETHEDYLAGKITELKKLDGNLLLDIGVVDLWKLVAGQDNEGATVEHYDNGHSYIGVGSSVTAADKTDTSLLGGTGGIWYKPVDATYPIVSASNKITFKATFTGSGSGGDEEAVFAWNEWTVARGVSAAYDYTTFTADDLAWVSTNIHNNLNRKVEPMGTKAGAATWVITVEISLT